MDLKEQEELIIQLKNNSENGFKLLYELYGKKIFNLAYRITGNKEDSKDIAQETLIQVYNNIKDFRKDSHIFTWIYTIAKNISFRYQQNKKRSSTTDLEELINSSSSNLEKPEWKVPHTELEKQFYIEQVKEGCLLGLLRCLSFNQRIAFIFHTLFNISIKDISIILNKTESAARTLVHRARSNIKEFLCNNCSIYDKNNKCKCENLIDFSLKKNWIQQYQSHQLNYEFDTIISKIENEINNLKKIILLYQSIADQDLPSDFFQSVQILIKQQNSLIFFRSKVK